MKKDDKIFQSLELNRNHERRKSFPKINQSFTPKSYR